MSSTYRKYNPLEVIFDQCRIGSESSILDVVVLDLFLTCYFITHSLCEELCLRHIKGITIYYYQRMLVSLLRSFIVIMQICQFRIIDSAHEST